MYIHFKYDSGHLPFIYYTYSVLVGSRGDHMYIFIYIHMSQTFGTHQILPQADAKSNGPGVSNKPGGPLNNKKKRAGWGFSSSKILQKFEILWCWIWSLRIFQESKSTFLVKNLSKTYIDFDPKRWNELELIDLFSIHPWDQNGVIILIQLIKLCKLAYHFWTPKWC